MNKFFSPDNIIIKFLTLFCDWMFYNWLFIFFSLPIITMGASFTAVYSLSFKRLNKKEAPVFKTFWKEFKANFKQSTLFWVPFLIICVILGGNVYISHNILDEQFRFLQYPASILLLLIIAGSIFVFPQISLFNAPLKQTVKNSVLLAITNIPTVFLVLATPIFILLLAGISAKMTVIIASLFLFFGFGSLLFFYSIFFRKIFLKHLPVPEEDGTVSSDDEEESPI